MSRRTLWSLGVAILVGGLIIGVGYIPPYTGFLVTLGIVVIAVPVVVVAVYELLFALYRWTQRL